MPAPYSDDLRQKAVDLDSLEKKLTATENAMRSNDKYF